MLKLNPFFLHSVLQILLFTAYWEKFSGTLSFAGGVFTFIFLGVVELLAETLVRWKFSSCSRWIRAFTVLFLVSLLIPFLHLLAPAALTIKHPGEMFILNLYNYLLPIIPLVFLFRVLMLLSTVGKAFNLGVMAFYAFLLSVLISRSGWMIVLPFDSLACAYAFIYLFLLSFLFLVLSGGERGRTLGPFHFLVLILLPLIILIPLSRSYRSESKKESGGLLESSLFKFDFSDYLSLESFISMKDDLVFMMKKEGGESDFMIRRFILPEYSGEKGFFRIPGETLESPGHGLEEYLLGEVSHEWALPAYSMTDPVSQEFFLVNFDSSAFLGLNSPLSVTPYQSWDHSSFSRIYRVDSMVSSAWAWDLMGVQAPHQSDEEAKQFIDYYTFYGDQKDLKETAENIISGIDGYYERVKAIENHLKENYFYSLSPGSAKKGDQLRHFLYESRKGYCSYFAFSMALLCRSVGIPARVALGFWVAGSSGVLGYYPVKANQAHAWVEVYFPGFGWIEFDPTSQTPAPGEEFLFSPLSAQEIEPYLREILENREFLKVSESSDGREDSGDSSIAWHLFSLRPGSRIFVFLMAFMLSLLFIRIIRIGRFLSNPRLTKRAGTRFFHLHFDLAEDLLRSRGPRESYRDYAVAMAGSLPELKEFVILYERIRFGWSSLQDLKNLFSWGKKLRRSLWDRQSAAGRVKYISLLFARGV